MTQVEPQVLPRSALPSPLSPLSSSLAGWVGVPCYHPGVVRQDESPPGQRLTPADAPEPGQGPSDGAQPSPPRFEEIFVPPPIPPSPLREAVLSPPLSPQAPAPTRRAASGDAPVDDENPLGVVGDRPTRRGPDAASSFEALVSQMFVQKEEPQPLDCEVERRVLWPWLALVLVVLGAGSAGYLYRDRLRSLLGHGGSAPAAVVEPALADVLLPPESVATAVPAPTEAVAVEPGPTPAPTPVPTAVPAAVDPASLPAATRIQAARWEPDGGGGSVVLEANGGIVLRRVRHLRLEDPPRELVRITGISSPAEPDNVAVGSLLVARIRLGHHPELSPPELYVVVDLGSPTARVGELQATGTTIRIPVR